MHLACAPFFYFHCSFYLADTLDSGDCHGQAGELKNKCPKQQHVGSQGGWSLSLPLVSNGRICLLISTGAQAAGLSPSVWVVNLWTFDRLQYTADPWTLSNGKTWPTCMLIVNQLKHLFWSVKAKKKEGFSKTTIKLDQAYMQAN